MSWLSEWLDDTKRNLEQGDISKFQRALNPSYAFLADSADAKFGQSKGSGGVNDPFVTDSQGKRIFDPRRAKEIEDMRRQIDTLNLDPDTKKELMAMPNSEAFLTALDQAKAGSGKYMPRKWASNYLQMFIDRPGMGQLFSGAASRSSAGAGLLTGDTNGLLTTSKGLNK